MAQRECGPIPVLLGSSDDRGDSSSPASSRFAQRLHETHGDAGLDGLARRASASDQAYGGDRPFEQPQRPAAGGACLWRPSFAKRPPGPAGAPARGGDQLVGPASEWRAAARPARPLSAAAAAASDPARHGQSTGFLPMMAVVEPERRRNSLAAMQMHGLDSNKFSARYHGMHTESNASA